VHIYTCGDYRRMLIIDRDRNSNLLYIYVADLDLVRLAGTSIGPQIESRSTFVA
jgi:hypothetical protein